MLWKLLIGLPVCDVFTVITSAVSHYEQQTLHEHSTDTHCQNAVLQHNEYKMLHRWTKRRQSHIAYAHRPTRFFRMGAWHGFPAPLRICATDICCCIWRGIHYSQDVACQQIGLCRKCSWWDAVFCTRCSGWLVNKFHCSGMQLWNLKIRYRLAFTVSCTAQFEWNATSCFASGPCRESLSPCVVDGLY